MNSSTRSWPLYLKLTCVLLSSIALGYLAVQGKEVLSPLLFAGLFAILLLPPARFLERRLRLKRGLAAMGAVLFLLFFFAALFYLVGGQISALASDWPQFKTQLHASVDDLQHWVALKTHINLDRQASYFNSASSKFLASGTAMVGVTLLSLSGLMLFSLFTFIYTFFLLLYRRLIVRFLITLFHAENATMVHEIIGEVQGIIRKYIVGLLIEMVVVSGVLCIAFSILGVKYAILLGLLGGLFNLIPYLGIFTALIVSSLITFATAASGGEVWLVIIVLVSTHLVDSNVLFPWIVGSKVRINALAMIIGVVVGGMIWGIAGMFLSIPVIAVMKIIADRLKPLEAWGILLGADEKHRAETAGVSVPDKVAEK